MPKTLEITALYTIFTGYPAREGKRTAKKTDEEVIVYNRM
jgi:hypothetical protein